jgi:hypothetical protein
MGSQPPIKRRRRLALVAAVAYAADEWPNWLRNFLFHDYESGRVVYSYVHRDINLTSFLLQELRVLGMFILLAILWEKRLVSFSEKQAQMSAKHENELEPDHFFQRAWSLSELFSRWQADSLLLAGACLPWTYFYWLEVVKVNDQRYLCSALLIHLIWGGTWILLSAPLWMALRDWTRFKLKVTSSFLRYGAEKPNAERDLKILTEVRPVGHFSLIGTSLVAVMSFALPLVNLFR